MRQTGRPGAVEPTVAGQGTKIGWDALLRDVRHEVAHQLLYESCMAKGAGRSVRTEFGAATW